LIAEVRGRHPETVFLAEAFTRPAVLQHLAKVGFSQSYTYFTWRNTKAELTAFVSELQQPPVCEYLRPNLFAKLRRQRQTPRLPGKPRHPRHAARHDGA
jgi:starch synthase (maltosyl-transferring)